MISFVCPECGVQLRVPATMAGIQGPCPACSALITAPHPEPQVPVGPASASVEGSTTKAAPPEATSPQEASPFPDVPVQDPEPEPAPGTALPNGPLTGALPTAPPLASSQPPASSPVPTPAPALGESIPIPGSASAAPDHERAAGPPSHPAPPDHYVPPPPPGPGPMRGSDPLAPTGPQPAPSASPNLANPSAEFTPPPPPGEFYPPPPPLLPAGMPLLARHRQAEHPRFQTSRLHRFPLPQPTPPPGTAPPPTRSNPDPPLPPTHLHLHLHLLPIPPLPPRIINPPSPQSTSPRASSPTPHPELVPRNLFPVNWEPGSAFLRRVVALLGGGPKRVAFAGQASSFHFLFLVLAGVMVWLVLDLTNYWAGNKTTQEQLAQEREFQGIEPSTLNSEARARAAGPPPVPGPRVEPPSPVSTVHYQEVLGPETDHAPAPTPDRERASPPVEGEIPLPPRINLDENEVPASPPNGSAPSESTVRSLSPQGVLQHVLDASDLNERRPYLLRSTRSSEALAQSCLGRPLPPVVHMLALNDLAVRSSEHREHFFEVGFQKEPGTRPHTIVVQVSEWPDGQMMVHTDAFLDFYEDALGQFGKGPTPGHRTFHVVGDPYKLCFDDNIPDPDNKSFIKLRHRQSESPRLKAYFPSSGVLAQEFAKPDGLPWGTSGICTVTVRWNTDTPRMPFVELVALDGFTWQP